MDINTAEKIGKMFEGKDVSMNSKNGFILISGNSRTLGDITRLNRGI